MKQQFEINFEFPVVHSDVYISLLATVTLHHSEPYYVVRDFHYNRAPGKTGQLSILPPQEIKFLKTGSTGLWVHCDSERESMLSRVIGKAIEKKLGDELKPA